MQTITDIRADTSDGICGSSFQDVLASIWPRCDPSKLRHMIARVSTTWFCLLFYTNSSLREFLCYFVKIIDYVIMFIILHKRYSSRSLGYSIDNTD